MLLVGMNWRSYFVDYVVVDSVQRWRQRDGAQALPSRPVDSPFSLSSHKTLSCNNPAPTCTPRSRSSANTKLTDMDVVSQGSCAGEFAVEGFLLMGRDMDRHDANKLNDSQLREFRGMFGTDPSITHLLWEDLIGTGLLPFDAKPKHLLWMCAFLRMYLAETVVARMMDVSAKTFRKWAWVMARAVAELRHDIIDLDNRFIDADRDGSAFLTVDGTDFRTNDPKPFNRVWFSHKFKAAGVRYEVAVSISRGDIVWVNGPFPCGYMNDLSIFRSALKQAIRADEVVIADNGYRGDDKVFPPTYRADGILRARHETINGRLKQWGCLGQKWRHHVDKHHTAFHAVVVITQIELSNGYPAFDADKALATARQRMGHD